MENVGTFFSGEGYRERINGVKNSSNSLQSRVIYMYLSTASCKIFKCYLLRLTPGFYFSRTILINSWLKAIEVFLVKLSVLRTSCVLIIPHIFRSIIG